MRERLRRHFGILYGVLVFLIVAIGAWWVVFLSREGGHYESWQMQRLATEQLHAAYLIRTVPEMAAEPEQHLAATFPELVFRREGGRVQVEIDPAAVAAVRAEAGRRRRMFLAEGSFFLALLAIAATILRISWRSQRDFERARELFLAGATHELKTPLASLRLYTETLQRPDLDAARAGPIRERMLQDIVRLERLVDRILQSSRAEDGGLDRRQELDVGRETAEVLAEMDGFLRARGAEVRSDLPPGLRIRGERSLLQVAVQNLVHNAVRHSPAPARVEVTLRRQGDRLRLAVGDRGPGIPRRQREAVFHGFQSRDRAGGGLGLYLVRRNTERLGGQVELQSRPGEGSTFTLVLPALDGGER